MHRSGLFWKVLTPTALLVIATALIMSAGSVSPTGQILLISLLIVAAVLHACWITRRVISVADSLAASIQQLGTQTTDDRWTDRFPIEVASLVNAVQNLERGLLERITELDRVNTAHADSTSLLETVLDTMVEGVVVLDNDSRILFANEAARPLLDIRGNEVLARSIWEVSRLSAVNEAIERVASEKEVAQQEFEIPRTRLIVVLTVTPLPRGPVAGIMLVLHDVTELRRLEGVRRDFVSNVSHELKTPLTSIQAYADTLLDTINDDPEQSYAFLGKIIEQSERLAALIVDVIRLGKIESQPDVFDIRPVGVEPIVAACLEAHAAVAQSGEVELTAEPLPAEMTVLADSDELRIILDNLVDNALRYTPPGGTVTVGIAIGNADDDLLGLSVTDTGLGIPKGQQSRIFERFYRVDRARDRARDRQGHGTGLGLSIVKHLCQLFGGRVELQSELGQGSQFTVWLPNGDAGHRTTDAQRAAIVDQS